MLAYYNINNTIIHKPEYSEKVVELLAMFYLVKQCEELHYLFIPADLWWWSYTRVF